MFLLVFACRLHGRCWKRYGGGNISAGVVRVDMQPRTQASAASPLPTCSTSAAALCCGAPRLTPSLSSSLVFPACLHTHTHTHLRTHTQLECAALALVAPLSLLRLFVSLFARSSARTVSAVVVLDITSMKLTTQQPVPAPVPPLFALHQKHRGRPSSGAAASCLAAAHPRPSCRHTVHATGCVYVWVCVRRRRLRRLRNHAWCLLRRAAARLPKVLCFPFSLPPLLRFNSCNVHPSPSAPQ